MPASPVLFSYYWGMCSFYWIFLGGKSFNFWWLRDDLWTHKGLALIPPWYHLLLLAILPNFIILRLLWHNHKLLLFRQLLILWRLFRTYVLNQVFSDLVLLLGETAVYSEYNGNFVETEPLWTVLILQKIILGMLFIPPSPWLWMIRLLIKIRYHEKCFFSKKDKWKL